MAVRNLSFLLRPASIALIGASSKPDTVGNVVLRNLTGAGFRGDLFPVSPDCEAIEGYRCYNDIDGLPKPVELALIATELGSVPGLIAGLGERGTRAAIVISGCLAGCEIEKGKRHEKAILEAARAHEVRILGPGSLGVMVPGESLNASFAHLQPRRGGLAFLTQSGAVLNSVLDWATSRDIGFSHLVSLGAMADVDFGDMLDFMASDMHTEAILLHLEKVSHPRKFMSAARAAARMKPVVVLKGGRYPEARRVTHWDAEGELGADAVYDAAFRRAGMLRVFDIRELFDAVETLAMARKVSGDRLAILTNGGGIGVLTTDSLIREGGRLAELSPETIERLDALLPPAWSRTNPVDILGDADAARYAAALEVLLQDRDVDALLVLNCPNALGRGTETARALVETMQKSNLRGKSHRLLTSWLGDGTATEARRLFRENRFPTYDTPDNAVRGFMHMFRYRRNQEMLMETPPSLPDAFSPDPKRVSRLVGQAVAEGRSRLTEAEALEVLEAYCIPVRRPEDNVVDLSHQRHPGESRDPGFMRLMDPGFRRDDEVSHELSAGIFTDSQFGPVVFFGAGGAAFELAQDRALALPPLNMHLARELITRTRICRLLEGFCTLPPADIDGVALTLVKLSQLACDIAEVVQLEINPLLVGPHGLCAPHAGIRVKKASVPAADRLAIRPYPKELEETVSLPDGQSLTLRPVRPEDEPAYQRLFSRLSPEDIFMRFMSPMRSLPRNLAVRLTQIDYDREMALVLVDEPDTGQAELYGGVRMAADADNESAEFAILLHRDMTGMGLGPMLMRRIIEYARQRGVRELYGEVLSENVPMLRLCKVFGFTTRRMPEDLGVMHVTLKLKE